MNKKELEEEVKRLQEENNTMFVLVQKLILDREKLRDIILESPRKYNEQKDKT